MDSKIVKENIFEQSGVKLLPRYIIMIISIFISSLVYNFLLQPTNIVAGGLPGLAIINKYQNGVKPYITIFIVSIIMLVLSYLFLGKERTRGTVVATFLYPLFVYLTGFLTKYINIDISDLLVISIFIGVISGFCNGILYKTGFSNGGLPIISQILFKYFKIPIGKTNFILNVIIILLGGYIFGTTMIMYAIIINYISSLIIDKIILGNSKNKAIYIMTHEKEKIKKFLIEDMKHTATVFDVNGGFLNKKGQMILTVVPTREYFVITESIKILDPNVFYVVNNAYEVKGGK